jgi:hypothetical protein
VYAVHAGIRCQQVYASRSVTVARLSSAQPTSCGIRSLPIIARRPTSRSWLPTSAYRNIGENTVGAISASRPGQMTSSANSSEQSPGLERCFSSWRRLSHRSDLIGGKGYSRVAFDRTTHRFGRNRRIALGQAGTIEPDVARDTCPRVQKSQATRRTVVIRCHGIGGTDAISLGMLVSSP